MEVTQVFHMNKGDGETSYAKNSTVQNKIISIAKPVKEEALQQMLNKNIPDSIGIADLGCSSGPNALQVISDIIDIVYAKCQDLGRPTPEFRVILNDLPCNDFNYIFELLPAFHCKLKEEKGAEFGPCFILAMPGSFYGRLFPSRSLHFVHSSSSLHWLSQVPQGLESNASTAMNKGKLYISKSSPPYVLDAYSMQFQRDFSLFLKSRAEEIVPEGCMVLSFLGRTSFDPTADHGCFHWELLARALMSMASEGLIEEKKIDSFNVPYYAPCPEELKLEIAKEGSFVLDRIEVFEVNWDEGYAKEDGRSRGERTAKTIRAVMESTLESHFGGGNIMDELFRRFGNMVDDYLSKNGTKYINLVMSIVRKA